MVKLRKDQEKAVRKIIHFKGRALLADEMRLGKTIVVLQYLKINPKLRPAIVVCPEIGKYHWEEKAKQHFGIRGTVLSGTNPPRTKPFSKNQLYIINWDILQYWIGFLKRIHPKIIILDECHYMKNPRTQCCEAAKKLAKRVHHIIAVGGTPLKSRPIELFTVLNLIRPDKFNSRIRFAFRYCKPERKPWGWEYKGAAHKKELHRRLSALCMIRRLRRDVFDEPPKDRRIIPLPISNKDEYYQAETNFIRWLARRSSTRANKARKAKRLVQMGYLKRLAASLKMPYVLKWIDNWLEKNDGKLVIFAIHKPIIKELKTKYKNICVVVDGSVRGRKRQLAVKAFQSNKKYRLFIGNTRAAGQVIELSKAKAMVGVELDWTPGDLIQAEDRILEQGKKEALLIYYLVARNTIEHFLCKILQSKQDVVSEILDGSTKISRLSIFDALEKAIRRREIHRRKK